MRGLWRLQRLTAHLRETWHLRRALRAIGRFPAISRKVPSGLPGPLILSLTSYPPRYPTLALTLKSLLDQRMQADRTILWVAHQDFDAVPGDVRALQAHGLEIRTCEDLRSFKKLLPTLLLAPDAFVVTADDDVYYPPDWLERLVAAHDPARPAAVGFRGHVASFDAEGYARPYGEWEFDTERTRFAPDTLFFPTGVGGILYPPGIFPATVQDVAAIRALCPHADDIWFFYLQVRHGRLPRRVPGVLPVISWDETQDHALFHENWLNGRNDAQMRAVEERYGRIAPGFSESSDAGGGGR